MKTNIAAIMKKGLNFGLIYAGISIVLTELIYLMDINIFSISFSIFSFLISVLAIPITIGILGGASFRKNLTYNVSLKYIDVLLICFMIFLIGSVVSNLFSYVFFHYIDTQYIKSQTQRFAEMMQKYNLPEEILEESKKKVEDGFTLFNIVRTSGILILVHTFLVAAISFTVNIQRKSVEYSISPTDYKMFSNPLLFDGRARRQEYWLSILIGIFLMVFLLLLAYGLGKIKLFYIFFIPVYWFLFAQGAKRCHDIGVSGWCQLIPFYWIVMMFIDSHLGENKYGQNPKGLVPEMTQDITADPV